MVVIFLMQFCLHPAFASKNIEYRYDANGNLIYGDGKYYIYNSANKLVEIRKGSEKGALLAEYIYDYTGQRVKKFEKATGEKKGKKTTYYVGKHFVKQIGGDQLGENTYYFGNGQRIARIDSNGKILFIHSDHLGSYNVMTDKYSKLIERTQYYPFGDIRDGNEYERYSFTGKEMDNSEYYYFEARYYNSEFRHFTQADTIVPHIYNPQSLNRYAYVKNNPTIHIDKDGHKDEFFDKIYKKGHEYYEKYINFKKEVKKDYYKRIIGTEDNVIERESKLTLTNDNKRTEYELKFKGNIIPVLASVKKTTYKSVNNRQEKSISLSSEIKIGGESDGRMYSSALPSRYSFQVENVGYKDTTIIPIPNSVKIESTHGIYGEEKSRSSDYQAVESKSFDFRPHINNAIDLSVDLSEYMGY